MTINALFIYLVQSALSLALLYLIFWFFLRKDTFFTANRAYLLGSIILSFVLPLFRIPIVYDDPQATYVVMLETITITANKIETGLTQNLSLNQTLFVVYITGVSIFLLRFIFQLLQLTFLIRKYGVTKMDGLNIVKIKTKYSPFSYFNYIFINDQILKDKNLKSILDHEKIHIEQKHSIDLIILEMLTVIQWFNPFIWLYKTSLKSIHEYLADEGILANGINKSNYQNILLNHTVGIQINDLTNNFNQSLIKKRFIMMTKNQSKRIAGLKLLLVLPVTAILIMFFTLSCQQNEVEQEIVSMQKEAIETVEAAEVEEVFTVVENMPSFKGGEKALYKFLNANIKYPAEAQRKGVQGRVYVSFVVEKDGSISDVKILRGIGSGCDKEAMRVVKLMEWVPGSQRGTIVRVQFNLPIRFILK